MPSYKFLGTLCILLIALTAYAYEVPLGAIVSAAGATTNNTTTATSFSLPRGDKVSVQCNATACILACGNAGNCATTCTLGAATTGVTVQANALFDVPMDGSVNALAIAGPAAVTCQVFRVLP